MSNHHAGSTGSTGARRNFARAAAAILLGLTLSSCSFGPPLEKDETARAIFDVENDKVILPLDTYNTDGKDEYFTKALTPWAVEQLRVLHEINPDPALRTPEQQALITDYARDTADAFMMVFQGYMLRSFFGTPEEKDHLYRIAMALLPE